MKYGREAGFVGCVVAGLVAAVAGCGDGRSEVPLGPPDAGAGDAAVPVPDAAPDAGGPPGSDGGADAPPSDPNPFPADPAGGEFAWVVSAPGARGPVAVAADA